MFLGRTPMRRRISVALRGELARVQAELAACHGGEVLSTNVSYLWSQFNGNGDFTFWICGRENFDVCIAAVSVSDLSSL